MRKLYENFHIFYFQKRIVSAETIQGNYSWKYGMFNALLVVFLGLFIQNHAYLYWTTKGDINYGSLSCHAIMP